MQHSFASIYSIQQLSKLTRSVWLTSPSTVGRRFRYRIHGTAVLFRSKFWGVHGGSSETCPSHAIPVLLDRAQASSWLGRIASAKAVEILMSTFILGDTKKKKKRKKKTRTGFLFCRKHWKKSMGRMTLEVALNSSRLIVKATLLNASALSSTTTLSLKNSQSVTTNSRKRSFTFGK
ncbi:hypothetical protein IV203_007997 [Nitzschia inconspicua]|uniref:Uncharacterized protein n=1 Tax=Nitzschia inconspicua TaxID=303405 RepID=A0A9K3KXP3_9STRA|nr:hypothetical protein IV203_007997 [Nitzschia inconspicua]